MDVERLEPRADNYGCSCRMISVEHLEELRNDIEERHSQGLFDDDFYHGSLSYLRFEVPKELPDAQTILVVSKPQPMMYVHVNHRGQLFPLIVPPTYADAALVDAQAIAALENLLRPGRYKYVRARLPLKVLAARSGLAKYGRNNITYVPKFGSYHRLTAFYSDAPCLEDQWREIEMLPGCEVCTACQISCPTKAIPDGRFLLRAERCLTFFNEMDDERPFPDWVDPRAHNALVGCMVCQKVCPYNKNVQYWSSDLGSLSEEETALLLSGRREGDDAQRLAVKLKGMGLDPSYFPRNLKVLLEHQGPG